MSLMSRQCPDCQDVRQFEQCHPGPGSCPDLPGGECPEWACTECGAALLTGPVPGAVCAQAPGIPRKVA